MAVHRAGLYLFLALVAGVAAFWAASRLGLVDRAYERFAPHAARGKVRLTAGDFPAGVAAPVGAVASVPLRPTRIGFTARGSVAALLLAAGGARAAGGTAPAVLPAGLLKTAYAMDAEALIFAREEELRRALSRGGEAGGVDFAAVSVDRLADWAPLLRDAAPRTVLLLGRSRGQDAVGAVGMSDLSALRGKRLAAYRESSAYYFGLWMLSRVGLTVSDVVWVPLASNLDAGRALREGRADAAVGLLGDLEAAVKDRDGLLLATSADAPHLIATVLVARGDYLARYPDAVRRIVRALLDAGAQVAKDPDPAARLLGQVAPNLGDPSEAIRSAPPAGLMDNLAFFGLSGEAPVTYDELYQSAAALIGRLGPPGRPRLMAEQTRSLGPLRYVSEARGL